MADLLPGRRRVVRRCRSLPFVPLLLPVLAGAQPPTRLSLGDVVRLATEQNVGVRTAHERAAQADARAHQRRADLLPSLSMALVESGRTFNTATLGFAFKGPNGVPFFDPRGQVEGPVRATDVRARLVQPLLDLGALERLRAARLGADAAGTESATAAEQVAAAAATAYVRLLRAEAQLAARRADSVLAADLLRIADDQLAAGTGIALDVTRARALAAQVRSQGITARADRQRAARELVRLLALVADADIAPTDSLAGLDVSGPAARDASPPAARPDVATLDAQLRAAAQQARALRREHLPVLSFYGDRGPIAGAGGAYLNTYAWGLQLSVVLFDGLRTRGRQEEQAAVQRDLEARRHELARQVGLDVRGALDELAAAQAQVDVAQERVALADQEVGQARERVRAGVAGTADVVTASLALNGARTLWIDALTAWHSARIALALARGEARSLR